MNEARAIIEQSSAGILTSMAAIFLQDAISTMLPWLFTMLAVILCDLAFGVRKSMKLGAEGHSLNITTWACLLVCLIEGMSIIGNMLKPYGYDLSVKSCVVFFLSLIFRQDKEQLEGLVSDEHLDIITDRERKKWGDVKKKNSTNPSK